MCARARKNYSEKEHSSYSHGISKACLSSAQQLDTAEETRCPSFFVSGFGIIISIQDSFGKVCGAFILFALSLFHAPSAVSAAEQETCVRSQSWVSMSSPPSIHLFAAGGWELFAVTSGAMALKMRASGPLNKEFPQYQQVSECLSAPVRLSRPIPHIFWCQFFPWLAVLSGPTDVSKTSNLFAPCAPWMLVLFLRATCMVHTCLPSWNDSRPWGTSCCSP
jgi:hypothetical protein